MEDKKGQTLKAADWLLRVEEAAELLAVKPSTIRAWLLHRKIGKVRVGARAVRIRASEIERIISQGNIPAIEGRR
jgi:excisionase family DNA binding protein